MATEQSCTQYGWGMAPDYMAFIAHYEPTFAMHCPEGKQDQEWGRIQGSGSLHEARSCPTAGWQLQLEGPTVPPGCA